MFDVHAILADFNRKGLERLDTDTIINYCDAFDYDQFFCRRLMLLEKIMHDALVRAAEMHKKKDK